MGEPADSPPTASRAPARTPWAWAAGTFCGIGLVGKGGGTVASVVTATIWYAAVYYLQPSTVNLFLFTGVATLVAVSIGIPAGTIVAQELRKKDPSEVVIDEVAGQLIALMGAPADPLNWKYVVASLVLFRLFDIFKPPPVRQLEALPTGTGIMMDDVGAGIYALLVMQLLHYVHAFARFS